MSELTLLSGTSVISSSVPLSPETVPWTLGHLLVKKRVEHTPNESHAHLHVVIVRLQHALDAP